jgi:YD repeat-containing protein
MGRDGFQEKPTPWATPTQRSYDAQGRLLKVTNAAGSETKMEFDSVGRPLRTMDALGRVTSYTTDSLGRRTSRTLPGGQTESMTWQNALQLASFTFTPAPLENRQFTNSGCQHSMEAGVGTDWWKLGADPFAAVQITFQWHPGTGCAH